MTGIVQFFVQPLTTMEIEPFEESDEGEVVALWERCGLTRPWNDARKDIARKLDVQRELFLVGKLDGKVVAAAMGGYDGHRGWVYYVAVDPMHQRAGLGRELMTSLETRLRALGCAKINLQIREDNSQAVEFYEHIGFTRDKVVCMGKRLERDDQ